MGRKNDDSVIGCCVVPIVFLLFGLPIVGVRLMASEDKDKKIAGIICFIVGILILSIFSVAAGRR